MGESKPAKNSLKFMGELNPEKNNSLNLMREFPSKEHWQNLCETLLYDFLEIDAIIGDIIFFYGFADHILHPVRAKTPFWGHC